MPHHKSCIKRTKTDKKRNQRNRMARSRMNTSIRKVLQAKKKDEANALLPAALSVVDKCTKTGILHRNNAANAKSRLTRHVNKLAG